MLQHLQLGFQLFYNYNSDLSRFVNPMSLCLELNVTFMISVIIRTYTRGLTQDASVETCTPSLQEMASASSMAHMLRDAQNGRGPKAA